MAAEQVKGSSGFRRVTSPSDPVDFHRPHHSLFGTSLEAAPQLCFEDSFFKLKDKSFSTD